MATPTPSSEAPSAPNTCTTDTDITATPPTPALIAPATTPATTHPATTAMDTAPTTDATDTTDTNHVTTVEDTSMAEDTPPTVVSTRQSTEPTQSALTAHAGAAAETTLSATSGECTVIETGVDSPNLLLSKAH